ncbi:hypothetical protein C0992_003669 [Termitomyces sp. T32_za158]|nr:hypothetical protein C0992_003669 [Termitomyces sp. T32_za158]
MSLSIFILAYALGTPTQILVLRFLAGFGGAAPQSLGGGVVGDLWSPEERGLAMSIYSLAPLVGPATGPLVGGWIAERATWPWAFWSVSIADALLQIVGFIYLRETYAPELLKRKAREMRKSTGNEKLRSPFERPDRHWTAILARGMVKPIVFLGTEPIVQSGFLADIEVYKLNILTAFVEVFTILYGESSGIAGIHYLAIALGSTFGGQVGSRVLNSVYRKLKAKNGGIGTPEMRWTIIRYMRPVLLRELQALGRWQVLDFRYSQIKCTGNSVMVRQNWKFVFTFLKRETRLGKFHSRFNLLGHRLSRTLRLLSVWTRSPSLE